MPEPIYSASTEKLWSRIPEFYRTIDASNDWQFKKYLSAMGDQLNEIDTLIARFSKVPIENQYDFFETIIGDITEVQVRPASVELASFGSDPLYQTSDLIDARSADPEWLPWIAQIFGVHLGNESVDSKRASIYYATSTYYAGSNEALKRSIQDQLTGEQYIGIYQHNDGSTGVDSTGTEWDVLVVTRPSETPDDFDIVNQITIKGGKPAGVIVHHLSYSVPWDTIETLNWGDIEAFGSWGALESYQP